MAIWGEFFIHSFCLLFSLYSCYSKTGLDSCNNCTFSFYQILEITNYIEYTNKNNLSWLHLPQLFNDTAHLPQYALGFTCLVYLLWFGMVLFFAHIIKGAHGHWDNHIAAISTRKCLLIVMLLQRHWGNDIAPVPMKQHGNQVPLSFQWSMNMSKYIILIYPQNNMYNTICIFYGQELQ